MVTREILNSYTATALRKEISKTNIRGYSKMTKKELIDVMMKNKERFSHMKQQEFVAPKKTKRGTGTVGQAKKFMAGIQDKSKEVKKTADVKPKKETPKPKPVDKPTTQQNTEDEYTYIFLPPKGEPRVVPKSKSQNETKFLKETLGGSKMIIPIYQLFNEKLHGGPKAFYHSTRYVGEKLRKEDLPDWKHFDLIRRLSKENKAKFSLFASETDNGIIRMTKSQYNKSRTTFRF